MTDGSNRTQSLSPGRLAFRKLRRHRMAMGGAIVLLLLYVTCFIFADFIAPYSFSNERRDLSYQPPTRIRIFDEEGKLRMPFIYKRSYKFDEGVRVYRDHTEQRFPISLFHKGDKHYLLGLIPTRIRLFGAGEPCGECAACKQDQELKRGIVNCENMPRIFLLGADSRGRDIFSRIVYGGRISLSIGLVGVAITFTIGMLMGGISGYFGGKIDNVIQRLCEMVMLIPGFYLMLGLRSAFPPDISSVQLYFLIVFILSFIGWAGMARVVRGMVLSIRSNEYVEAARAIGQSNFAIITRHVLPQTMSYAIVSITLSVPGYILGESALSLLGLGIQEPYSSWGNMLREAMKYAQLEMHPWVLIPGFFIFITVMAFSFLGDGLRDALDPRSQLVGKEFDKA